jgi:hypothetical protein
VKGRSGKMDYEEQYPLLVAYGLHKVIKDEDDPMLWEQILRSYWGTPETLKYRVSRLRFIVITLPTPILTGEGGVEVFSFLHTPGSFTAYLDPEQPGIGEIDNLIQVTRPSKGREFVDVVNEEEPSSLFGPARGKMWRRLRDGNWHESDGI